ncbi:MAG: hypothetical protein A2Z72_03985 [Omnitrophica bacterium RBG_13_46_9]|nr:MAG: hypothetical protein A2Z72_03985 [Omnitrophica bacterium RBG_13_46_9]
MELDDMLKDKITLDIVKFFHENQSSIDTPRGIATWIKAEKQKVKKSLDMLVKQGILIDHKAPSITGYSYTRDEAIIKKIDTKLKEE